MDTTSSPSLAERALKSSTLQQFIDCSRDSTGKQFGFPRDTADYAYYSPQELLQLEAIASRTYLEAGLPTQPSQVIGLRAFSSAEWVVSFLSIIRLGHTALILSPILAIDKVDHIVNKAGCKIIIDGTQDLDDLEKQGKFVIPLVQLGSLKTQAHQNGSDDQATYSKLWADIKGTDDAIIMHSSGSGGAPSLVHKTHGEMMSRMRAIPAFCHDKSFFVGSRLYTLAGLYSMIFTFVKSGGATCWESEKVQSAPEVYRDILLETRPQMAWFNPSHLMTAMATKEGFEVLTKCITVTTTGHPFPEELGNRLTRAGAHLINEYASTQLAFGLTSAARPLGDPDWEYMQADPLTAPHLWFRPLPENEVSIGAGDNTLYELVVLPSHPTQESRSANSPDGSYHTGDLFVKHPAKDAYKCVGRIADNVELCPNHDYVGLNAHAYENKTLLGNEDILEEAVLFGDSRPEAGLLLFAKPGCSISSAEIVERVWDTVQSEINNVLPYGLRKEMLVVVRDAVVPRTPKGNVVRPDVYTRYEKIINEVYVA